VLPATTLSAKSYTLAACRSTSIGMMLPPMSCLLDGFCASRVTASISASAVNT
jgi:hypothetical protein